MIRTLRSALVALLAIAAPAIAQQQIGIDIYGNQAVSTIRIAIPDPTLGQQVSPALIESKFLQPLRKDLAFSGFFTPVALPPGEITRETAQRAGAQALVLLKIDLQPSGEYLMEARVYDVTTEPLQLGKRYTVDAGGLTRLAHTFANDLVRHFTGNSGMFLSTIAFISDRTGPREVWLMDYDGSNQRQITNHGSMTLTPSFSPDGERLVYTGFTKDASHVYVVSRRGGRRDRIDTGVNLNTSPVFSPDGTQIAFVGSIRGNPDIYVIRDSGSHLRRLTSVSSIESTPSWSPTGRQIAFTSGRSGSPQIYVMDAEGTNVRRISFEGSWNDDAVWSPRGDVLAYTSRVSGRFQIRLMNVATGESRLLAGEGSNEQPAWSPDGRWLLFMSNRSGRWQIYRIGVDGRGLEQLTLEGENWSPDWVDHPDPNAP
ncbi:MAG: Tol-Pal system beta propeller repeat protein TolB [Thermoanaerobaculia bacterium]